MINNRIKNYLYHFQLWIQLLKIMICEGILSLYLQLTNTIKRFLSHHVSYKYGEIFYQENKYEGKEAPKSGNKKQIPMIFTSFNNQHTGETIRVELF